MKTLVVQQYVELQVRKYRRELDEADRANPNYINELRLNTSMYLFYIKVDLYLKTNQKLNDDEFIQLLSYYRLDTQSDELVSYFTEVLR